MGTIIYIWFLRASICQLLQSHYFISQLWTVNIIILYFIGGIKRSRLRNLTQIIQLINDTANSETSSDWLQSCFHSNMSCLLSCSTPDETWMVPIWEMGVSWLSGRPESDSIVCHRNFRKLLGFSFLICKIGEKTVLNLIGLLKGLNKILFVRHLA